MINFYNDKFAPWMLCKLLYDVVPWKFHQRVIFSWGNRYMPKGHKISLGVAGIDRIWLNLKAIAIVAQQTISASRNAGIWRQMLKLGFHEFSHIALGHCKRDARKRYSNDRQFRQNAEDQAYAKAEEWMGKILACNGRLYQPDFLGMTDIVWREHQNRLKTKTPWEINWLRIKDTRCHITGGQLSAGDVVQNLFKVRMEELDLISPEEWQAWLRPKIRLVHKHGDDLARVHIDSAERQHRFWVWGDVPIISRRLVSYPEAIEKLKKGKE